jgi:hypothetical protein
VRVGGVLSVLGQKALHAYLVNEIQEIYRLPVCRRLAVDVTRTFVSLAASIAPLSNPPSYRRMPRPAPSLA